MEFWGSIFVLIVLAISIYFNIKFSYKFFNKKEEFMNKDVISSISHDLRTPLNAICGYSELLKIKFDLDENAIKYIDTISDSANLLLELINDILDESKIMSGKMTIHKKSTNISDLVNHIEGYHALKANEKNIEFQVNLKNVSKNENIFIDELRVKQILNNLISNAIKFTTKGGVYVHIEVQNDSISIIVEDTGIGIAKKFQKNILKKYRQESSETVGNFGGTGLGLSITESLVKLMDGHLDLISQKDIGTTFSVIIPTKGA